MRAILLCLLCLGLTVEAKPFHRKTPAKPQGVEHAPSTAPAIAPVDPLPGSPQAPEPPTAEEVSRADAIAAIEAIRVEAQKQLERADSFDKEIGNLKAELKEADVQAQSAKTEAVAAEKREQDLRDWGNSQEARADKAEKEVQVEKAARAKAEASAVKGWSCFIGLLVLIAGFIALKLYMKTPITPF